jgi:hypothetical protein
MQKISIVSVTVEEGLTKDEILKVTQSHQSKIEKCFAGKNLQGTLKLSLTINPDGTLKSVEIAAGLIKDVKLRQCIIEQVKKWIFPATTNGQMVKATITFKI